MSYKPGMSRQGIWFPGTEVFTSTVYDGPQGIVGWTEHHVDTKLDSHVAVRYINDEGKRDFHFFFISEVFKLNKENWCKQILKWMKEDDINNPKTKESSVQVHSGTESRSKTSEE